MSEREQSIDPMEVFIARYAGTEPHQLGTTSRDREREARTFIRRVRAEAWDEGHRAGAIDQEAWDGWRYYPRDKHPTPNPYREDNDE